MESSGAAAAPSGPEYLMYGFIFMLWSEVVSAESTGGNLLEVVLIL